MEMYESYVRQIQRYPLLDVEQEAALSRRVEAGDEAAFAELVQRNLRLVVSVANRFAGEKASVMDLIQEGNIALMAAARKYHYSFNTRFSTYAYSWVLQYMLRYLYYRTSPIVLPQRKEELLRRVARAQSGFAQQKGREATVQELSEQLNVERKDLEELLSCDYSFASLDVSGDGEATMGDFLPDSTYNPEELLLRKEIRSDVHALVDTLPRAERTVIFGRYNFAHELKAKTLRELSVELAVSAETVRQMEMRAVRRLRKQLLAVRSEVAAAATA